MWGFGNSVKSEVNELIRVEGGFIANPLQKKKDNLKVECWKSDIKLVAESYREMC